MHTYRGAIDARRAKAHKGAVPKDVDLGVALSGIKDPPTLNVKRIGEEDKASGTQAGSACPSFLLSCDLETRHG